ncbi:helix-turn-helix domain-containing protein [Arthrobacter bussei]|uniref:Helix-turn-helix domain-containing protein n=1 Tax=Arthrobacter bussei TaxID=2594179 RepID=A0A7X1TLW2_9MICC|nr:helix-turn-helix domain-containing protein [Arthrobacter bussei]MPY09144.1 helix-turn-helix domain-containing protein [Arthrobacter bussei]
MTDQPHDNGQPDQPPRPLRFLTLQQVADELNTKHSTIRALIASGDLPAIQIGGRGQWRIERTKLEDYITGAYAKARTDIARGDVGTTLEAVD